MYVHCTWPRTRCPSSCRARQLIFSELLHIEQRVFFPSLSFPRLSLSLYLSFIIHCDSTHIRFMILARLFSDMILHFEQNWEADRSAYIHVSLHDHDARHIRSCNRKLACIRMWEQTHMIYSLYIRLYTYIRKTTYDNEMTSIDSPYFLQLPT